MAKFHRQCRSMERSKMVIWILAISRVIQGVLVGDQVRIRRLCALLAMRSADQPTPCHIHEGTDLNKDPLRASAICSDEQDQITDMLSHQHLVQSLYSQITYSHANFLPTPKSRHIKLKLRSSLLYLLPLPPLFLGFNFRKSILILLDLLNFIRRWVPGSLR
jgi:hypothetical protein